MSPDQATDLAARILAAIDRNDAPTGSQSVADYCRERVASDLRGITDTFAVVRHNMGHKWSPDWDVMSMAEYLAVERIKESSDGLLRTAALYDVTP